MSRAEGHISPAGLTFRGGAESRELGWEGPALEKQLGRERRDLQGEFWPGWGGEGRQTPAALPLKASVADRV